MGIVEGIKLGKNLEKTIINLEIGEGGWAKPEALEMYYGFKAVLDLDTPVFDSGHKRKDTTLHVKRVGLQKNDFEVNISNVDNYRWRKLPVDKDEFQDFAEDPSYAILDYSEEKTLQDEIDEAVKNENYELAQKLKNGLKGTKK